MKNVANLTKIFTWANEQHANVNQYYDNHLYSYHLNHVLDIGIKFQHLIPHQDDIEPVLISCICHDILEDTRNTYNDLKEEIFDILKEDTKYFNQPAYVIYIAEIVYAVTNEKGRNRKERANEKYYQGIKNTEYATFVKLCDRIANIEYSKNKGSSMFNKYKKEHIEFKDYLYDIKYKEMFDYIDQLLND